MLEDAGECNVVEVANTVHWCPSKHLVDLCVYVSVHANVSNNAHSTLYSKKVDFLQFSLQGNLTGNQVQDMSEGNSALSCT